MATQKTEKTDTTILRATVQNELFDWFNATEKELGFKSHGELIEYFKNLHQQQSSLAIEFTPEEEEMINQVTQKGISREEIFKIGILSEVKKRYVIADNFNFVDMPYDVLFDPNGTFQGKSLRSVAGIGEERVKRTVQAVMAINDKAEEPEEKSCITAGLIFTLCGANRATINKFLELHKGMIDDHNFKHNLTVATNRKGTYNWLAQLASLELKYEIEPKIIKTIARFKDMGNL